MQFPTIVLFYQLTLASPSTLPSRSYSFSLISQYQGNLTQFSEHSKPKYGNRVHHSRCGIAPITYKQKESAADHSQRVKHPDKPCENSKAMSMNNSTHREGPDNEPENSKGPTKKGREGYDGCCDFDPETTLDDSPDQDKALLASCGLEHQDYASGCFKIESSFGPLDYSIQAALRHIVHAVNWFSGGSSVDALGHFRHSQPVCNCRSFHLEHESAVDLVETTLRLNCIVRPPARVEYFADSSRVHLKMPESSVHSSLAQDLRIIVTKAGAKVLPGVGVASGPVSMGGGQGQYMPDAGWTADAECHLTPRLVCEVAYSQTVEDVKTKLVEYVRSSDDDVQAAIGVKLYYPKESTEDYNIILQNMHQCYICL